MLPLRSLDALRSARLDVAAYEQYRNRIGFLQPAPVLPAGRHACRADLRPPFWHTSRPDGRPFHRLGDRRDGSLSLALRPDRPACLHRRARSLDEPPRSGHRRGDRPAARISRPSKSAAGPRWCCAERSFYEVPLVQCMAGQKTFSTDTRQSSRLIHERIMTEYTLPKTYDFHATEQRIYEWWEKSGYFKPANDPNTAGFRSDPRAVRHLHPAAQCDRRAAPGTCHVRLDGRPDDPLPPHEGLFGAVGAGQRPRRHRHPAPGGESAGKGRSDAASRSGGRSSCAAPGPGKRNTAASSPARSAAWAPPAIGSASASPWTPGFRAPCAKPSCACTKKA